MSLTEPLISFVVINYNYGSYVGQAIDSVLQQEYGAFECVVLDNGSTDDSRAVLSGYAGKDSRLRIEFLDANLNQLGAFLHVLDELRGEYVTIVDADDFLFTNYASTHVMAHQVAPGGVAFTSSCVLEVDGDGQLLTSGFDAYLESSQIARHAADDREGNGAACSPASAEREEYVHLVPASVPGWHWSPGTANMHKLELIRATRPRPIKRAYVGATDNYFMWLNHAIAGSAKIDLPLSAYRIHGRNRFGSRASITGLQQGTPAGVNRSAIRCRDITRELTMRPTEFAALAPGAFWRLMDAPAVALGEDIGAYYRDPYVVKIIKEHCPRLVEAFGEAEVRERLRPRVGSKGLSSIFD